MEEQREAGTARHGIDPIDKERGKSRGGSMHHPTENGPTEATQYLRKQVYTESCDGC